MVLFQNDFAVSCWLEAFGMSPVFISSCTCGWWLTFTSDDCDRVQLLAGDTALLQPRHGSYGD